MKEIQIDGNRLLLPEIADNPEYAIAADGGTIAVWFVDPSGTTQNLFLDRRIRSATRDHIYRKVHPGSPGTEHIGFSAEAVEMMTKIVELAQ